MIDANVILSISRTVVSAGVGQVIGNVIKTTMPKDLTKIERALTVVGSYAIGAVTGDVVANRFIGMMNVEAYMKRVKKEADSAENKNKDETANTH